jgi:hypothetical protein
MEVKRPVSSARLTGANPIENTIAANNAKRVTGFFFMTADLFDLFRRFFLPQGETLPALNLPARRRAFR